MKKLFVFISLLVAFYVCSAQENSLHKEISGIYTLGGYHENGVSLVLNKDSTYKVSAWSDVAGEFIGTGKWTLKGDTIIFTESKEKDSVATVVSTYNPKLKGSRFEVRDGHDSLSMPLCHLFVDEKKLSKLNDSVFVSDSSGIRHLRLLFSTTPVYIPDLNVNHNSFLIYLDFTSWQKYAIDPLWIFKNDMLVNKARPRMKFVKSPKHWQTIRFTCYTKSRCTDTLKLLDDYKLSKPGFAYYALGNNPVAGLPDTGIYFLNSPEITSLGDSIKVHIHSGKNVDTLKQMDLYQVVTMPKDHRQKGGKVWAGWFYCDKKASGHCIDYYQNGNKRVKELFAMVSLYGKYGFTISMAD